VLRRHCPARLLAVIGARSATARRSASQGAPYRSSRVGLGLVAAVHNEWRARAGTLQFSAVESEAREPLGPPTQPVTAYLDNSALGHLYRRQAGATEETELHLRAAVADGRLVIPFSLVTAEEALSAFRSAPEEALAKSALYLDLTTKDRRLRQPRDLLSAEIASYANGYAEPQLVLEPFRAHERALAVALTQGQRSEDIEEVIREARRQIEWFHQSMQEAWSEAQELVREQRQAGNPDPTFMDLWRGMAEHYAEGFAREHLDTCRRRGIAGLLGRRRILALVGGAVGLIYHQAVNGRKPDYGDSRDQQHLLGAVAAGGLFVTDDDRLTNLVAQIPGLSLETVRLVELACKV
jgi:hypothetical protein